MPHTHPRARPSGAHRKDSRMTKYWRTALLTPALALTLALAACGGSSNSDEDTITKLVKDVNETPATYCDNASKTVLDAIGGKDGCLEAVKGEKGGTSRRRSRRSPSTATRRPPASPTRPASRKSSSPRKTATGRSSPTPTASRTGGPAPLGASPPLGTARVRPRPVRPARPVPAQATSPAATQATPATALTAASEVPSTARRRCSATSCSSERVETRKRPFSGFAKQSRPDESATSPST